MLGTPYMARQGSRLVVGATRDDSFTPERALGECGRLPGRDESSAAVREILGPQRFDGVLDE